MDKCTKCGWVDADQVGDWDSMVARCSHCEEMVCGQCWDKYHATKCGSCD